MKTSCTLLVACVLACGCVASADSPITKVMQLLSDLQAKVMSEGEEAKKAFAEFSSWCQERSANLGFEIKTAKAEKVTLEATIEQETALIGSLTAKTEELAGNIATDNADLKAATEIRGKEATDFGLEDTELAECVNTLERAVAILDREMRKGSASMMQLNKNAGNIVQALKALVQASVIDAAGEAKLTALVQSNQQSESDDEDTSMSFGAPAADVYQGHSGSIVETLENLLDKAKDQLSTLRNKESTNKHNFQMLEQSLKDEIKFAEKDMGEAKKGLAESAGKKASAVGDLAQAEKVLGDEGMSLDDLHQLCMTRSQDNEAATKSRAEELAALSAAKKTISEQTGGAAAATYSFGQTSFVQIDSVSINSKADLANFEAVRFVRDLARKYQSTELSQLAMRMGSAMRAGAGSGDDPFAKVKTLIKGMIERLGEEAGADASHKAYCDKELGESREKKADKSAEINKLATKIDDMSARSAQLKEEVAELQKTLAELASSQAEMTSMRQTEKKAFGKNKVDMEQGLAGVKLALKILREYYAQDKAHEAAEGAGTGIVGLLEVVESDFSKGLAEYMTSEDTAAASYDKASKQNQIEKAATEQDVHYKSKESADLDKAVGEATSDRAGVQTELDAVLEYIGSLDKQCSEKAESYGDRKGRREAEIAGLKEALNILRGESVLLQSNKKGLQLRGFVQRHA